MHSLAQNSKPAPENGSVETGLRDRKKAMRRQEILQNAGRLFALQGFDATTMAEIANETGVSPPTIFNYFGSKDNILTALLLEGAERERKAHLTSPRRSNESFADILGDFLCECAENTESIAGKRVWRYAESANIRLANSEFQRQFSSSDDALLGLISRFLGDYDLVQRAPGTADPEFLAKLFFDRWTDRYMAYIKDDQMPIDVYMAAIRSDVRRMVVLLFDETFAAASPLKAAPAMR